MKTYDLRSRARHEHVLAAAISIGSPALVEALAATPFDALLIDAEHSPFGIAEIEDLVRAADVHRMPCLVRVPEVGSYVGRVLDVGAAGVVVPRIETAAQAAEVVSRARYAPLGERGVGVGRGSAYGVGMADPRYTAATNDRIIVAIQIESGRGVDALDEILGVGGLDAVLIGPGDLAVSLGTTIGSSIHRAATDRILEAAAAHGLIAGAFSFSDADTDYYREAGVSILVIGGDIGWMTSGARAQLETVRSRMRAREEAV